MNGPPLGGVVEVVVPVDVMVGCLEVFVDVEEKVVVMVI
jgi:hypothetical protein